MKDVFGNTKNITVNFSIFLSLKIRWIRTQEKLGSGYSKMPGSVLGLNESGFETLNLANRV
jgi:hypothetical protein